MVLSWGLTPCGQGAGFTKLRSRLSKGGFFLSSFDSFFYLLFTIFYLLLHV